MRWLNYHHLFYFWVVARRGGISQARSELRLSQPTISSQLKALEEFFGDPLFEREGRRLRLSVFGQTVFRYAEQIFGLGRELLEVVAGQSVTQSPLLRVGISDEIPKLITHRLLCPALAGTPPPRLVCHEDKTERLLAGLGVRDLDLVLAEAPADPFLKIKVYNHLLGECGTSFMAAPRLATRARRKFPQTLSSLPLLLPTAPSLLRTNLERWLEEQEITPCIAGEFQDSALMKIFGQAEAGIFPVPTAIEEHVKKEFHVRLVGRVKKLRQRFYAISIERKITNPAVVRVCEAARSEIFSANK